MQKWGIFAAVLPRKGDHRKKGEDFRATGTTKNCGNSKKELSQPFFHAKDHRSPYLQTPVWFTSFKQFS